MGLVLSGGAARGIAHLGVLKGFEEYGFEISHIFGSSVGAIIGGLYCSGISVDSLSKHLKDVSITDFIKFKLSRQGMFSSEAIETYIKKIIGKKTLNDCEIPLTIISTNILTGKGEYFQNSDVSIALAARASASIPGIFSPTCIKNKYYVDGAVSAHMPVPRNHHCSVLIGCNAIPETELDQLPRSAYAIIDRSIDCALRVNSELATKELDFVLNPLHEYFGSVDLKSRDKLVECGYNCVKENRRKLERLIND